MGYWAICTGGRSIICLAAVFLVVMAASSTHALNHHKRHVTASKREFVVQDANDAERLKIQHEEELLKHPLLSTWTNINSNQEEFIRPDSSMPEFFNKLSPNLKDGLVDPLELTGFIVELNKLHSLTPDNLNTFSAVLTKINSISEPIDRIKVLMSSFNSVSPDDPLVSSSLATTLAGATTGTPLVQLTTILKALNIINPFMTGSLQDFVNVFTLSGNTPVAALLDEYTIEDEDEDEDDEDDEVTQSSSTLVNTTPTSMKSSLPAASSTGTVSSTSKNISLMTITSLETQLLSTSSESPPIKPSISSSVVVSSAITNSVVVPILEDVPVLSTNIPLVKPSKSSNDPALMSSQGTNVESSFIEKGPIPTQTMSASFTETPLLKPSQELISISSTVSSESLLMNRTTDVEALALPSKILPIFDQMQMNLTILSDVGLQSNTSKVENVPSTTTTTTTTIKVPTSTAKTTTLNTSATQELLSKPPAVNTSSVAPNNWSNNDIKTNFLAFVSEAGNLLNRSIISQMPDFFKQLLPNLQASLGDPIESTNFIDQLIKLNSLTPDNLNTFSSFLTNVNLIDASMKQFKLFENALEVINPSNPAVSTSVMDTLTTSTSGTPLEQLTGFLKAINIINPYKPTILQDVINTFSRSVSPEALLNWQSNQ